MPKIPVQDIPSPHLNIIGESLAFGLEDQRDRFLCHTEVTMADSVSDRLHGSSKKYPGTEIGNLHVYGAENGRIRVDVNLDPGCWSRTFC